MSLETVNFGNQVRRIRKDLNMSQEKLAGLAGIDRAHMGHIERGSASPTLKKIHQIAAALGINVKELFDDVK
jgi:transcriptional regulator with XRE-family HTH domain